MAKVSINSSEISSIISELNSSCNSLESEVFSKVKSSFQVLADLGLVSNCVTKIQQQAKTIVDVEKTILNTVSEHLGDVSDNEIRLNSGFISGYSSNGSYFGGSITTSTGESSIGTGASGSDITVDEKNEGKKINADNFSQLVNLLTDDEKKSLLELIKTKKDDKTELIDLLLDTNNSEKLYKILQKVLKDVEFENLSLEDTKKVQKILLNSLVNSKTDYVELKENSILMAKEYFVNISKDYQISIGDLMLDDTYSNVLKDSIKKMYNGTVDSSVSNSEIEKFRSYIDSVAEKNGINAEELLNNRIKLLL